MHGARGWLIPAYPVRRIGTAQRSGVERGQLPEMGAVSTHLIGALGALTTRAPTSNP